jgi:hypothetical protein
VARAEAKVVKETEKAKKAAKKQRQKEACDSAKSIQLSQKGKRKASRALPPKNKR